ncbi:MAG: hypothetical protein LBR28_03715 [Bacteroidales bacterium]|jgi:hypothetical protein|nr:hypothetical protein [Bacteroidales bacterium]
MTKKAKLNRKVKLPKREPLNYKWDLIIIAAICLAGYILIKYFYPYPITLSDSGGYVVCAMKNSFSFYRPFGYSQFLRIVHAISPTVSFLTFAQLLLYFISTSVFAFTIKYFFPPCKQWIWRSLLVFLTFSPLAFYLINSIMSDLLFSTMIYFMLSGLVFVIMKGGKGSWFFLLILFLSLFFSLHIRYSAMIFPFIIIPFFCFLKGHIRWISILCSLGTFFIFHNQIKSDMRETTGYNQFSTGFDGWQYANNAIHITPYADKELKNQELNSLHKFLLLYNDSIKAYTNNGNKVTERFIWNNNLPLKQYLFKTMKEEYRSYPDAWVYLGSGLYRNYGRYLMLHNPSAFMRYYYLPNSLNIIYPTFNDLPYVTIDTKEIKEYYNIDESKDLSCRYDIYGYFMNKTISISHIFIWTGIVIIAVFALVKRKKLKFNKSEKLVFWSLFSFGAIYYASTVFASPVAMRYWLPMASIQFACCYIILNKLNKLNKKENNT